MGFPEQLMTRLTWAAAKALSSLLLLATKISLRAPMLRVETACKKSEPHKQATAPIYFMV